MSSTVYHARAGPYMIYAGGSRLTRLTSIVIHERLIGHVSRCMAGRWGICIDISEPPLRLISTHLPHSGLGSDAFTDALEEVEYILATAPNSSEILWGVDASAQLAQSVHEPSSSAWSVGPVPLVDLPCHQAERSEQLAALLYTHGLIANNTWTEPNAVTHVPWAFTPPRMIDYLISRRFHHPTRVCDLPAGSISDHRPLSSTVLLPTSDSIQQQRNQKKKRAWLPPHWTPLKSGQFKARACVVWDDSSSLDAFCRDLLPLAASSSAPTARTLHRMADSNLLRAYLQQPAGSPAARSALRKLQQHRRRHTQQHQTLQIQRALEAGGGKWQRKHSRSTVLPPLTAGPIQAQPVSLHAAFWQGIHASSAAITELQNLQQSLLTEPRGFSPEELHLAYHHGDARALLELLRTFNPTTAAGKDGLPLAVFFALPLNLLDSLATTFRQIMEAQRAYPQEWKHPCVRLLPKKINPTSPAEYRPISVNSIIQRLHSKWLYSIVKPIISQYTCSVRQLAGINGGCSMRLTALRLLWIAHTCMGGL